MSFRLHSILFQIEVFKIICDILKYFDLCVFSLCFRNRLGLSEYCNTSVSYFMLSHFRGGRWDVLPFYYYFHGGTCFM